MKKRVSFFRRAIQLATARKVVLLDDFSGYADTTAMLAGGWSISGDGSTGLTLSSGRMRVVAPTTFDGGRRTITGLTVGRTYVASADYEIISGGQVAIRVGVNPTLVLTTTGSGKISTTFVASSTSENLQLITGSNSTGEIFFDNILVRSHV